jgi:acetyl-CoA carboxylase carboxyltransferase component
MSWQREVDELRRREALAREMGGPEKVERHKRAGKLTVRERIDRVLDAGSFHEIGAVSGFAEYTAEGELEKFSPTNFLLGRGKVDRRPVVVIAGGLEAAYKAELQRAENREQLLAEITTRLDKVRSPFRTAESFLVEEIIDPRDTRPLLCEFANLAAPLRTPGPSRFGVRP